MNMQLHNTPHTDAQDIFYSSGDLAQELGVGESTVRTRWFEWIAQVAPSSLLKESRGYTELARTLFHEFAEIEKRDRQQWVNEAKTRYTEEWSSVNIIEGELVPAEVGGALAAVQQNNSDLAALLATEMEEAIAFGDQLENIEADFSAAELEEMKMQGALRGVKRFKIMKQAELQTFTQLRQRGEQSE